MTATAIQPDYDKELIAYLTKLLGITQNKYISPAIREIFNKNVNNFLTDLILTIHSSAVTSLALDIVNAEIARLKLEQTPIPPYLEDKRILISDNLEQAKQREAAAAAAAASPSPSPSYNTQRAIEPFRITRDDDNKGLYAYLTELSTKQHKPVVISTALEIVNTEMITKLEREGNIPQILKDTHAKLATAAAAALENLNTDIATLLREQKLIPQPIPQILKDHARLATAVAAAAAITPQHPSLPGTADDMQIGGSRRVRRRNKHGQRVKSRRSSSSRSSSSRRSSSRRSSSRRRRRRTIQRRF